MEADSSSDQLEFQGLDSVDGVTFASHEGNFAGDTPTGSTVITKVTLNPTDAIEVPGSVRPWRRRANRAATTRAPVRA